LKLHFPFTSSVVLNLNKIIFPIKRFLTDTDNFTKIKYLKGHDPGNVIFEKVGPDKVQYATKLV